MDDSKSGSNQTHTSKDDPVQKVDSPLRPQNNLPKPDQNQPSEIDPLELKPITVPKKSNSEPTIPSSDQSLLDNRLSNDASHKSSGDVATDTSSHNAARVASTGAPPSTASVTNQPHLDSDFSPLLKNPDQKSSGEKSSEKPNQSKPKKPHLKTIAAIVSLISIVSGISIGGLLLKQSADLRRAAKQADCDSYNSRQKNLSAQINTDGIQATAIITNSSPDCSYEIGFASYEKFSSQDLEHQLLYDSTTTTIGPDQTAEVTIKIPDCAAQLDVFVGPVISDFRQEQYGGRLIEVKHINNEDYCTPDSSPTPTPTPSTTPLPSLSPSPSPEPITCNDVCVQDYDTCPDGLFCYVADDPSTSTGNCRNLSCPTETDCLCTEPSPTPNPTPSPTPSDAPSGASPSPTSSPNPNDTDCNSDCTQDSECSLLDPDWVCFENKCRHKDNTGDPGCNLPRTFSCNSDCETDGQCQSVNSKYFCIQGNCRHIDYPAEESCQPPIGGPEPSPTHDTENITSTTINQHGDEVVEQVDLPDAGITTPTTTLFMLGGAMLVFGISVLLFLP